MNDLSRQKINSKIENVKRFNNSHYESKQSLDKFFQKNGYLYSLIFVFFLVPILYCSFLFSALIISSYVHWVFACLISLSGVMLYFYYNKIKKKKSTFIQETVDKIELSTPLYFDLTLIFSGLLFFSGILIISFSFQINLMFIIVSIIAFYSYFQTYKKLRFSLFDKIEVSREKLKIDYPESKESIEILKNDISKIVLLTIKDSFSEKKIIEFQFETNENYKTIEINQEHIKNLRLSFDLVIESLKKMEYHLFNETQIEGKINRIDEHGNQILN